MSIRRKTQNLLLEWLGVTLDSNGKLELSDFPLKTINNESLVGTGNIAIETTSTLSNLSDVTIGDSAENDILKLGAEGDWVNTPIKTINNESIFGTGNITAGGGGTLPVYLPNQVLDKDNWTLNNGKYEYTITNELFTAETFVQIGFSDATRAIATAANIGGYNPVSSAGSLLLKADSTPSDDVTTNFLITTVTIPS